MRPEADWTTMMIGINTSATILAVDDQQANLQLLQTVLELDGYTRIHCLTDARDVLERVSELHPDLILLDLHMPYLDGFAVLKQLQNVIPASEYLPILVLTADSTPSSKMTALSLGAKDFLTKPLDVAEVRVRVRNLLETRSLHLHLIEQNQTLEQRVQERTVELGLAQIEILQRLGQAAEYRDDATGQHTRRVGDMAGRIGVSLGLGSDEVDMIRRVGPLHDVGKIAIPDWILLKPGKLTAEERMIMETHTTIGAQLLAGGRFGLLQLAEEGALSHHERWDGTGYPRHLIETEIPLIGRIVAVADVFDALTHARPYKEAWPVAQAVAEIERLHGGHFDPTIVGAFLDVVEARDEWGGNN